MSIGLKIIVAAVNLVCLIVTLIYPNDATPISLLPCWVTAGMWIYNRLSSFSGRKTKALVLILPLVFLTICASFSFCIGFACEYISDSINYPYYEPKSDAMIPFNLHIDFRVFQIFVFVVCFLYYVAEIVFEFIGSSQNTSETVQDKSTKTPTQLINELD